MRLRELAQKINEIVSHLREGEDLDVVVRTKNPSVGYSSVIPVMFAGRGIDWDKGRFMLHPERELVLKQDEENKHA